MTDKSLGTGLLSMSQKMALGTLFPEVLPHYSGPLEVWQWASQTSRLRFSKL